MSGFMKPINVKLPSPATVVWKVMEPTSIGCQGLYEKPGPNGTCIEEKENKQQIPLNENLNSNLKKLQEQKEYANNPFFNKKNEALKVKHKKLGQHGLPANFF